MPQIGQKQLLELTGLTQADLLGNVENMTKINKMKEMKPKQLWKDYGKKALTCFTVQDLKTECQIYGVPKIPTKKDDIVEALNKIYEEEASKHGKRKAEDSTDGADADTTQPAKRQALDSSNGASAADGTTVVFIFVYPGHNISRLVAVPAGSTFDKAMEGLLKSINFDFEHQYRAKVNDTVIIRAPAAEKADTEAEGTFGDKTLIDLKLKADDDIDVIYDFTDEHKFRVLVKEVKSEASTEVKVLESKGIAPPQYGTEEEEDDEVEEEEVESEEEEASDEYDESAEEEVSD